MCDGSGEYCPACDTPDETVAQEAEAKVAALVQEAEQIHEESFGALDEGSFATCEHCGQPRYLHNTSLKCPEERLPAPGRCGLRAIYLEGGGTCFRPKGHDGDHATQSGRQFTRGEWPCHAPDPERPHLLCDKPQGHHFYHGCTDPETKRMTAWSGACGWVLGETCRLDDRQHCATHRDPQPLQSPLDESEREQSRTRLRKMLDTAREAYRGQLVRTEMAEARADRLEAERDALRALLSEWLDAGGGCQCEDVPDYTCLHCSTKEAVNG